MTKNTFYVTTAIDYASGNPHIGHLYEKISADIISRWNRNIGKETFFMTGTDEHGQKILEKAKENNLDPKAFVDKVSNQFLKLCKDFDINYDYFIRTTNNDHKKFAQEMIQKAYNNQDIYKGSYEGLYCVGCEKFYTEKELDNGNCPIHKTKAEKFEEETYFFKLSKYQDKLLKLYESNPDFIRPKAKAKETINRVKEGLRDLSLTRVKSKLDWGIECPFDNNHVIYVWFDALFNYVSGLNINNKNQFWPANYHIIGHDIAWFHNVYWPAFLMSVGIELPKTVFVHGMILDDKGHKMSKSLGNVIDPYYLKDKVGVDELKFFLFSATTFGEDFNFSYTDLVNKVNNDLNNDLGNLVSRVHAMTTKYFDGIVPKINEIKEIDQKLIDKLNHLYPEFDKNMQDLKYNHAIENLWTVIRDTNAYVNEVAPWKEQNKDRLATVINILVSINRVFAEYIDCFMPNKASLIFEQLNFTKQNKFEFEETENGHKLNQKNNIFAKLNIEDFVEKRKDEIKETPKHSFEKVKLIVGQIMDIRKHPEADKLYIETIDIGEEKPRQIVSGLKDYYEIDELRNKKVIVVANLKPAKMRGVESQGMILAVDGKDGEVGIVTTNAKIGAVLKTNKYVANADSQIKIDDFFSFEMKSNGKTIYLENEEIKADNEALIIDRNVEGKVR